MVEHTDGQRWQKDCKKKFTKLEEHQTSGWNFIHLADFALIFFFSLSLILAYLDFQRSALTGILIAGMLV